MGRDDCLFSKVQWFFFEGNQRKELTEEVNDWDENQLLNTSVEDFCRYFVDKYRIDIPVLNRDGIVVDQHETRIDVSKDRSRAIRDRSQPFYIPGTEIEITVPFTGDSLAFTITPTIYSLNPPSGNIRDDTLIFFITGVDLETDKVRDEINSTLKRVDSYLTNLRTNAQRH